MHSGEIGGFIRVTIIQIADVLGGLLVCAGAISGTTGSGGMRPPIKESVVVRGLLSSGSIHPLGIHPLCIFQLKKETFYRLKVRAMEVFGVGLLPLFSVA